MKKIFAYLCLAVVSFALSAQKIKPKDNRSDKIVGQDTNISTPFFAAAAGWTFPMGDIGKEYKSFFNVDAYLGWKTADNLFWALNFTFQFGSNNAKNLESILSTLYTNDENSFIIATDGTDAGVVGYNRNLSLSFSFGKTFPIFGSNPNSGLALWGSIGYLQHQIIFQYTQGTVKELDGDYKYGYDRQKRGPMFGIFAGYMHISKRAYANWFVGAQFNAAFTKMTRDYQFDMYDVETETFLPTDKLCKDYMLTFKIGWMFPFFGRSADKIYYF